MFISFFSAVAKAFAHIYQCVFVYARHFCVRSSRNWKVYSDFIFRLTALATASTMCTAPCSDIHILYFYDATSLVCSRFAKTHYIKKMNINIIMDWMHYCRQFVLTFCWIFSLTWMHFYRSFILFSSPIYVCIFVCGRSNWNSMAIGR